MLALKFVIMLGRYLVTQGLTCTDEDIVQHAVSAVYTCKIADTMPTWCCPCSRA